MRLAVYKDDKGNKHIVEVMGTIEALTGFEARLRFEDGTRKRVPVQKIRMIQDPNVPRSKDGWF
tara:strand:- start:286 stop:477 length:192 start_codon:yes stop_codon:yes gene_type:complete